MILYHKSNLVYKTVFAQFLIFQQNNSAQTSVLIFFTSRHYYFFEKLKTVEKQLCKLNCSYGKVSHTLERSCREILKMSVLVQLENTNLKKKYQIFPSLSCIDNLKKNIEILVTFKLINVTVSRSGNTVPSLQLVCVRTRQTDRQTDRKTHTHTHTHTKYS